MTEIESLSKSLGEKLILNGWSITTAESCTGGGISAAITEIAGSSAYFNNSFITYSNQSKQQMLGVPEGELEELGAVSEPVAKSMALGALNNARANVAIAVTGIAGPSGGTQEKPVGTVYLAIALNADTQQLRQTETTVQVYRLNFEGSRKDIRISTIKSSLINTLTLLS